MKVKKILALFLVLCLTVSLPVNALAIEQDEDAPVEIAGESAPVEKLEGMDVSDDTSRDEDEDVPPENKPEEDEASGSADSDQETLGPDAEDTGGEEFPAEGDDPDAKDPTEVQPSAETNGANSEDVGLLSDALTYGDLLYTVEGSTVTITGCTEEVENFDIPAEIDGKAVTKIASYAFNGRNMLKTITLPEGVTYLGYYFLAGTSVESLTIPSTVKTSGVYGENIWRKREIF